MNWLPRLIAALTIVAFFSGACSSNTGPTAPPSTKPLSTIQSDKSTQLAPSIPSQDNTPVPISPVPKQLVIISPDNVKQIIQLDTIGKGMAYQANWSSDGRMLAVRSPKFVYLYDTATMQEMNAIRVGDLNSEIVFSHDGKTLIELGGNVRRWQVSDGTLLGQLEHGIGHVMISSDGTTLAGSVGKQVQLYALNDTQLVQTFDGPMDNIRAMALSPDDAFVAAASGQETSKVYLWRVSTGELLHTFDAPNQVTQLIFSPDGADLAVVLTGNINYILVWEIKNGTLLNTLHLPSNALIDRVAFSPTESTLGALDASSNLILWQMADGTKREVKADASLWDFSPDGALVATSGHFKTQLLRASDGSVLHVLQESPGSNPGPGRLSFSPDGKVLAMTLSDFRLWQVDDGAALPLPTGHSGPVRSIAFSPDGKTLASGSDDNTVRLWNLSDGKMLRRFDGHLDTIASLAFSPDGTLLASGSADKTVRIWTANDGTLLHTFDGLKGTVERLVFSADGSTLTAGVWTPGLIGLKWDAGVWQVSDGRLVRTFQGYFDSATSVLDERLQQELWSIRKTSTGTVWAVSPNAILALCVSSECQLWQLAGKTLLQSLKNLSGQVNSVAFSSKGDMLATGSIDGTIQLWGVR